MAERRMFAKSVINSARFLRMPQTSRLLYYDLGMAADDDGVVEAFTVIRTTGAAEDDLKVLASKGFVTVLNEDLVSYITDWGRNNYIQKDRYHPSVYAKLLVKITEAAELDSQCIQDVSIPDTEVRLGKDRLEKGKEDQEKKAQDKDTSSVPEDLIKTGDCKGEWANQSESRSYKPMTEEEESATRQRYIEQLEARKQRGGA